MQHGSRARRLFTLLLAVLGWALFLFWWRKVALESTAAAATVAVVVLAIITVAIFYSTILWIRHNLKLARRGKRGFSTRWIQPRFDRDHLKRRVVFSKPVGRQEGTWFVVHSERAEKRYSHQRLTSVSVP